MPSQPEAQGDILKEFREGTFLSSLDKARPCIDRTFTPSNLIVGANDVTVQSLVISLSVVVFHNIP